MYKSERQRTNWRKVKKLAVTYFTDQFGDLPIDEITREHALAYKVWWAELVFPKDPMREPLAGNTANRRIGGIADFSGRLKPPTLRHSEFSLLRAERIWESLPRQL